MLTLFAIAGIIIAIYSALDIARKSTRATAPDRTPEKPKRVYKAPESAPDPLFADMLRQVHLLIAGTTGSGKSVLISNIMDAAIHSTPDQLQLILIDPKKVELIQYSKLPHIIKYASDPNDMVNALQMGLDIINRRFAEMQALNMRQYPGGHVYIVIDEFADLLTTDKKRVKPILQRILQIGRAANVHCIAATQYVYATVIDSTLKCLFDCRVALRTKTKLESRLIMDRPGLEELPRHGKAYYITPERDNIIDIPYLTDETIADHVEYWKRQG